MNSEFTIAVHALVFLNHKRESVSSDKLAANICTNPARVRKIMGKLKKKGLISTKEGVVGGYLFDLDPSKVTLYDVSSALDVPFVSSSWRSGGAICPVWWLPAWQALWMIFTAHWISYAKII